MTPAPRKLTAGERPDLCGRVQVFIDGDLLRGVIAYDIDAGRAEVIYRGDDGKCIECGSSWVTYWAYGTIKAVLRDEEPA